MPGRRPDISDVLAYEIKKEIADRYFGFRKLIEEDKLDFLAKAKQYSLILEKRISFDLIRIYILLQQEELIGSFLSLTGIPKDLFYDPYLTQSATIRERVFGGVHLHGLTHSGRFKNLFLDSYERLESTVGQYRAKIEELREQQEDINEEIKVFYQKNDLGTIMGFLQTLGDKSKMSGMEGGMEIGMAQALEHKMQIEPQLPVENYLPMLPPLPQLSSIKGELKKMISKAFDLHGKKFLDLFAQAASRAPR